VTNDILQSKQNSYRIQGKVRQWYELSTWENTRTESPNSNCNIHSNWGECETWCFPRFHTWDKTKDTFCFLSSLSTQSKPVLPVDDTSIIIYHPKSGHFRIVLMVFFPSWTSGLKQTNFSYTWQNIFATNNISSINLNTCYDLKIIEVVTKFLGLQTDDNLNYNWNNIPKFNQALWWQQSRQQMT